MFTQRQPSATSPPQGPIPSSYQGPYNVPPGCGREDGGGPNLGDRPFNPYLDSYMDPVLPLEDLPSWDGADDTAIHYILEVREHASLGGYIPYQLGGQLWRRFKKDSPIYNWYMTLSPADKAYMRSHYTCFLGFIWDVWLGERWLRSQRAKYRNLAFRQAGHSRELPDAFIRRRLTLGRMLSVVPAGKDGNVDPRAEVAEVIRGFPLSWRNMFAHDIPNAVILQLEARGMPEQLIYAYEQEKNPALTQYELESALRRLGVTEGSESWS